MASVTGPRRLAAIGQSVAAVRQPLRERYGLRFLGFEKRSHGKTEVLPTLPDSVFEADDEVFTLVDEQQVAEITADLRAPFSECGRRASAGRYYTISG